MTPFSMTGFARHAFDVEGVKYAWELKSVNARGLEIRIKFPPGLDGLESAVRETARKALTRGSCFFVLERGGEADRSRLSLNEDALALVVAAARRLASVEGIAMPSADGLLAIPGVLQDRRANPTDDGSERRDVVIVDELGKALAALREARGGEGRRLHAILADQLGAIERLVETAEVIAAEAPDVLKARIREQVALLTTDGGGLDPDRLHQEAILIATRADVREELDRLRSHLQGARDLLNSGDAVGRRLEFLAQEFNREANTVCSKASDRRLTAAGIELKAVIDQFREQVQNLE